ncbi:RNaseH domain-containing protein [Kitasatospora cystarginea]
MTPTWTPLDLAPALESIATAANGTAAPAGLLFRTAPDTLAALLCGVDFTMQDPLAQTARTLRFLPSPTWQGAEVVSWPPMPHPVKKKMWWYSLTVRITLQTVLGIPHPVVYVHTGVRRWITEPVRVPSNQAIGVTIRPGDTWVEGAGETPGFASSGIVYRNGLRWRGILPDVLTALAHRAALPSPEELIDQPKKWLDGIGGTRAGLIHHTTLSAPHEIGAGLMPVDRQPLNHWIAHRFGAYGLKLQTTTDGTLSPRPGTLPKPRKKQQHHERRARLATRTGGEAAVHILHTTGSDTPSIRAEDDKIAGPGTAIGVILDDLGFDEAHAQHLPGGALRFTGDGLTLTITQAPLGKLAAALPLPAGYSKLKAADRARVLAEATDARIREVIATMAPPPRKAVALVELPNADHYPIGDPKDALRIGLARSGYRAQFFTPVKPFTPEEDPAQRKKAEKETWGRIGSTWLDARRHLGDVVIHRPRLKGLPDDIQYVGLWAVTARNGGRGGRRYLCPIAVLLDPVKQTAQACARDVPWCDLSDFALHLPDIAQPMPSAFNDRIDPVATFLQTLLQDLNTTGRPTLLLTDAHNLRTMAPGLQNAKIALDSVTIGKAAPRSIALYPGLRHVHVRSCGSTFETPQAYAVKPPTAVSETEDTTEAQPLPEYGFSSNVWPVHGSTRVFHSTGGKPGSRSDLSRDASTLIHRMVHDQLVIEAHKASWNPRPLELSVVACQPADLEPQMWAHLAHYLRATDYYDALLALPFPLHLAKKLGEYLLPLGADSEEDTDS